MHDPARTLSKQLGLLALAMIGLFLAACSDGGEVAAAGENGFSFQDELTAEQTSLVLADLPPETQLVFETFDIDARTVSELSQEARASLLVTIEEVKPFSDYSSDFEHEVALADWTVSCLKSAGFPAEREEGTAIVQMLGDGVTASLSATEDDESCFAEASIRFPLRPVAQTREEWQPFYDRQLANAACLQEQGIDVPPEPSFDEFVDSSGRWTAYDAVPDSVSEEEWLELNRSCPQ